MLGHVLRFKQSPRFGSNVCLGVFFFCRSLLSKRCNPCTRANIPVQPVRINLPAWFLPTCQDDFRSPDLCPCHIVIHVRVLPSFQQPMFQQNTQHMLSCTCVTELITVSWQYMYTYIYIYIYLSLYIYIYIYIYR